MIHVCFSHDAQQRNTLIKIIHLQKTLYNWMRLKGWDELFNDPNKKHVRNVSFFGILDSLIPKILTIICPKGNNNCYKHTVCKYIMFYIFIKGYSQAGEYFCIIILLSSFYGDKADYRSSKSMHFVVNQARILIWCLLFTQWVNLG